MRSPVPHIVSHGSPAAEPWARGLALGRRRSILVVLLLVVAGFGALFAYGQLVGRPPRFAPSGAQGVAIDAGAAEIIRYTLDARSRDNWVFFSFDSAHQVESAAERTDWDLAFRRTQVRTNSGVMNPAGSGGAMRLGDVALSDVTIPEPLRISIDELDADGVPANETLSGWYRYSFVSHTIHAKKTTFLVRHTVRFPRRGPF
jgi:hypothetical protein